MIPRFYNFALGNDSTAWKRCPGAETKKRVSVPAEGGSGFRLSLTRGPLWRCGSLRQKVLTERRLFAIIIWLWIWRCIEVVVTRTTRNPSGCFAGCLHITRGNVNFDVLTGFKACLNDAFSNNILTATVPSFKVDLRYTNRKFTMKIYLEMYRSGRNENDSKSFCP